MKYNDPRNRAIIGGCRYCGKTTELIKMAARHKRLIVCATPIRAKVLSHQAQYMGLLIEPPLDITTLKRKPELLQGREVSILIDDVEDVLEVLLGKPVCVMSTSANLEPMKCLQEEAKET